MSDSWGGGGWRSREGWSPPAGAPPTHLAQSATPPPPGAPKPSRRTLSYWARAAVVPAIMGAFIGLGGWERFMPQDPYDAVDEEIESALVEIPGFEERFGELDDEEAFAAGVELGTSAVGRLDDGPLLEWAQLTTELLEVADEATCADIARGTTDADDSDVLRSLDVETYRTFLELVVEMVRIELEDVPGPMPPTQAESDAAALALYEQVGAARMEEMATVFADPNGASDAEACALIRHLFEAINAIDGPARLHLLRDIGETLSA